MTDLVRPMPSLPLWLWSGKLVFDVARSPTSTVYTEYPRVANRADKETTHQ